MRLHRHFAKAVLLSAFALSPMGAAAGPTLSLLVGPSATTSKLPIPQSYPGARVLSPHLGAELAYSVKGLFDAGFFYEQNHLGASIPAPETETTTGRMAFYGGFARIGLLGSSFADLRAGFSRSLFSELRSSTAPGLGVGFGYRHTLAPFLRIGPRIGYRWLPVTFAGGPTGKTASLLDFDLLFSIGF